jgi:hypothetical protein
MPQHVVDANNGTAELMPDLLGTSGHLMRTEAVA